MPFDTAAILTACHGLQELELTLPPFALVPTNEHTLVPMVSLPNGKAQSDHLEEEHGPDRLQMVSEYVVSCFCLDRLSPHQCQMPMTAICRVLEAI